MPSARSWLLPFTRPPTNTDLKNPRVNVVLDRDRAAALNLNWNSIASTLYDAFGPQLASTIYSPTNQYRSQESAGQCGTRPRPRGGAEPELELHRQHSVRCLRPAAGFYHLLAHQPIPISRIRGSMWYSTATARRR